MAIKKTVGTLLYEQVIDTIREMIINGQFHKGDLLPSEKKLMDLTGVSRITVREALKALAEMGIIETRKGKGSFVTVDAMDLSPDQNTSRKQKAYQERFFASEQARLIVEPEMARLAARNADKADIAAMEDILSSKKRSRNAGDLDEFHMAIAKAAGNPLLVEFIEHLLELESEGVSIFRLTLPEKQKRESHVLAEQHQRIFEAIKNKDEEFAYFYMKEHTCYLLRSYEEYFRTYVTKKR